MTATEWINRELSNKGVTKRIDELVFERYKVQNPGKKFSTGEEIANRAEKETIGP
jgi:hypothetical protein